jgi:hypothetical protein
MNKVERRDMRKIPIPQWEARTMTAKRSGPWALFFQGDSDKPLVNPEAITSTEFITNPKTNRPASTLTVTSTLSRARTFPSVDPPPEFVDSYTLMRWERERDEANQSLFVRSTSSLSMPSPRIPYSGLAPDFGVVRVLKPVVPNKSSFDIGRIKTGPRRSLNSAARFPVQWNPRFGRRVAGFWRDD